LEELAYSMPGLLTPGSVSRQQLQQGTVIAQVGQVYLAQGIKSSCVTWEIVPSAP
jgi:hypothetical protein